MSSPPPITYLTAVEVAAILRISPAYVVNLCRKGKLKATKPSGTWLIAEADLMDYLEQGSNARPEAS